MAAIGLPPLCLASLKDSAPSNAISVVYATLGGRMETNEVHALSMKTYTPDEWSTVAK
jgi:acid stress-induced BolA-like protein IbaG/YrbA